MVYLYHARSCHVDHVIQELYFLAVKPENKKYQRILSEMSNIYIILVLASIWLLIYVEYILGANPIGIFCEIDKIKVF